jgi:folate-binding Fe-S cluster repair protein YgfZ
MIDAVELSELGFVSLRGRDARTFLQGQLTNDVDLLSAERSIFAALANAQGRVIQLVRVLASDGAVLLCLPSGDAPALRDHLARYVLRAKVELRDESAAWRGIGILDIADEDRATLAQRLGALPARAGGVSRHRDLHVLAIDAQRLAVLGPTSASTAWARNCARTRRRSVTGSSPIFARASRRSSRQRARCSCRR